MISSCQRQGPATAYYSKQQMDLMFTVLRRGAAMQYLSKDYTIRDLAKECGVSIATASKALNGYYTDVSPKTREIVIQTANRHGYIPNNAAQNLKRHSSRSVVLLFNDPQHPTVNASILIYTEITGKENYKLVVRYANGEDMIVAALKAIKENKAAGIIMVGDSIGGREKEVSRFGIPVLVLESAKGLDLETAENVSCFCINNIKESYRMTKYLIEKGAREIALFTTEQDCPKVGGLRTEGYKMALKEAGLVVEPNRIVNVEDIYFESGYKAAKKLIEQKIPFSALLCVSDNLSLGAMRAFHEEGIKVPKEVMVAGFDGSRFTDYVVPSITTSYIPVEDIYRDSGQHLMDRICRNAERAVKEYPGRILEKESTLT